ncbi:SigE family RNA polymerase sigma factor [Actinomycetota bacterium Odt1-20B]
MPEPTVCFPRHEEFAEYVRLRRPALLRSARRLVADPADAEDLLQTALMRTRAYWAGIADKSLADAYLLRAMINLRTEWWRARRLEEVPIEHLPETGEEEISTRQLLDRHQLLDALMVLSVRQRSVVVLRYWEELSTQETAHALAMSTGTVKSTLHRSLTLLRQELAAQETAVRTG